MSDSMEKARRLKERAKTTKELAEKSKNEKLYTSAIGLLDEATALLLSELKGIESQGDGATMPAGSGKRQEAARELADCYGLEGGIYRRLGQLEKSIEMYDRGYYYEKAEEYDIQDSYNLTNSIIVRILKDAGAFPELKPRIEEAAGIVQKQVEGKRRREWWAWADLGVLYSLAGKRDEALEAYKNFTSNGPLKKHYASAITVLEELKQALDDAYVPTSDLIVDVIGYLNSNKPAA